MKIIQHDESFIRLMTTKLLVSCQKVRTFQQQFVSRDSCDRLLKERVYRHSLEILSPLQRRQTKIRFNVGLFTTNETNANIAIYRE